MAEPSTGPVEYASDSSEPIIEDITELCDFCVMNIEGMLEIDVGESQTKEVWTTFRSNINPGMCRCCELITQFAGAEFISDWDMGRRETSEGRRYSRICAMHTEKGPYAVWADPGKNPKILCLWTIVTIEHRQRCMGEVERPRTNSWPAHKPSSWNDPALAEDLQYS